jgi:hypothetical protein
MRRISGLTATVDSKFTNGNPATAVPATIAEDWWLNNVQESIATAVEAAGLALPIGAPSIGVPDDFTLLKRAILILTNSQNIFQAVVGSAAGCTHATLAEALADASVLAGSRILVTASEAINTMVSISKANVLIEFQPGVTFSKGAAVKGLQVNANGVRIRGGRFSGFNGGADKAIEIAAGSNYCLVSECRFATNTTDIDDLNGGTSTFGLITE